MFRANRSFVASGIESINAVSMYTHTHTHTQTTDTHIYIYIERESINYSLST